MKSKIALFLELAKLIPPKWQPVVAGVLLAVFAGGSNPALLDYVRELDAVALAGILAGAATMLGWSAKISKTKRTAAKREVVKALYTPVPDDGVGKAEKGDAVPRP